MKSSQTSTAASRTCPCKTIPWSLSSFTAAEYGDVSALSQALAKSRRQKSTKGEPQERQQQSCGITPLHLAAQHGHVAATWMLLEQGHPVDGTNNRGSCTPLHRASFSGATATMRLILETKRANLLARDTSFGDERTPLHKAAAGGRYLAVALLLDALREEGLLKEGLQALDKNQETPLRVARVLQENQTEERQSVARWDVVAGGSVADWDKVVDLISKAEQEIILPSHREETKLPKITNLPRHKFASMDCLDCEANGECVTASWTAAFQKALGESITFSSSLEPPKTKEPTLKTMPVEEPVMVVTKQIDNDKSKEIPASTDKATGGGGGGRQCESCGRFKFALFPTPSGLLVCKKCRPNRRR